MYLFYNKYLYIYICFYKSREYFYRLYTPQNCHLLMYFVLNLYTFLLKNSQVTITTPPLVKKTKQMLKFLEKSSCYEKLNLSR